MLVNSYKKFFVVPHNDGETVAIGKLLARKSIPHVVTGQAWGASWSGLLVVVRLAHSKTATITDRLFGAYQNLLVVSDDGETNFFGNGEICLALQEKFGGWSGGQLPESGFWGGYASQNEVEVLVKSSL